MLSTASMPVNSHPMARTDHGIGQLSANVAQAGNSIDELEKRLAPILNQDPRSVTGESANGPSEMIGSSPICVAINDQTIKIRRMAEQLASIISRLEC